MKGYKEITVCKNCGRPFSNRKKWKLRALWHAVVYCSNACRK